jgi:hypothetical protein
MNEKEFPSQSSLNGAITALRRYMMEKGNCFEHGPTFEGNGKVLAGVRQATRMYEGMGYVQLAEIGDPPVYALLQRGHRELHIFQPRDPQIKQWLEDKQVNLNDPAIRAYMLQQSGLRESDIPIADKPRCYHINAVDDVFIVTSDDD